MGRRYIVKQRARIDTITGPVNLPYGTTVEAVEDYLIHQGRQLCAVPAERPTCILRGMMTAKDGSGAP